MDIDEYVKLQRMAKTGKYTVIYNNIENKTRRNLERRKYLTVNNKQKRGNSYTMKISTNGND